LLIVWDVADWKLLRPLLAANRLPHLAALLGTGSAARLFSTHPHHAAPLLTTLIGGLPAENHGVLLDHAPAPDGRGIEPWPASARIGRSLLEHLAGCGLRVAALGWPAHDATLPNDGFVAPPGWASLPSQAREALAPAANPALREALRELAIAPAELAAEDILPFRAPGAHAAELRGPEASLLARAVADSLSQVALGTWLQEHHRPALLAIRFSALAPLCERFMTLHPPRLPGVPEEDFAAWHPALAQAYTFHDTLLGTLLSAHPAGAPVLLASPLGWHSDHLRPTVHHASRHGLHGAWKRPEGVAIFRGPAIRTGRFATAASLLDLVPTTAALLGLAPPTDRPGRVLTGLFATPETLPPTSAWETDGPATLANSHPVHRPAELGTPAHIHRWEARYALATRLLEAGKPAEALSLFGTCRTEQPSRPGPVLQTIAALRALGRTREAASELESLAARPDASLRRDEQGRPPAFLPQFDLMRGLLAADQFLWADAITHLKRAREAAPQLPDLHLALGRVWLAQQRPAEAAEAFRRAAELDPENSAAAHGLAACEPSPPPSA
jgi:hypothetical protein